MNTIEFLTAVWPRQTDKWKPIYCIVHGGYPSPRPGQPDAKTMYKDHGSISAMAAKALALSNNGITVKGKHYLPELYFVMHGIRELIERPNKEGTGTWLSVRKEQRDMLCARCFHGDLDVAKPSEIVEIAPGQTAIPPGKYASQEEALADLRRVCAETGFPMPLTVNSGRGWHVYWLIEDEIDSETWLKIAAPFQAVMKHAGLKLDGEITTNSAHMLRVVGTWHRKDPNNPLKVVVGHNQEIRQPNAEFIANVERLRLELPAKPEHGEGFNHDSTDKPSPKTVAEVCPTFRAMVVESLKPGTPGKVWLNMNTLALHTKGGPAFAHKMAESYHAYDFDETQGKIDDLLAKEMGPTTCGKLSELDCSLCSQCTFNPNAANKGTSPIVIARRLPKVVLPEEIPEPGFPYLRTKRGIERQESEKLTTVICPYNIHPISVLDEEATRTKSTAWVVELPLRGPVEFRVPATAFNDPRELNVILANQGLYITTPQVKKTGEFMSHYIRLLQQRQEERKQYVIQGWVKGYTACLVGDTLYTATGSSKVDVSKAMVNIVPSLQKKGTLAGQIETMKFYEHPDYVQQQFMIGVSLGAVLMFMTQYFGVIVNFSGDTGVAKSTVVTAGANMWGDGEKLLMNGTAGGMTANAKAGRIAMYANIPGFLDEITLMEQGELREMTMGISQKNPLKIRNQQNGTERELPDIQKATVLICTSNQSPHDQLSQNNLAGTAAPARIFNAHTQMTRVHTKTQADAFIMAMRRDQGHIGPEMVQWVLRNMDAVRDEMEQLKALVDRVAQVTSGERYWAIPVVLSTIALRICKRAGLLNYDDKAVLAWGIQQIIEQRQIVAEIYSDPVDILHGYIAHTISNTLTVYKNLNDNTWAEEDKRRVHGQIKGRYEIGSDVIYLSAVAFKEYCDARKVPHSLTEKALIESGVVFEKKRIDLARNTLNYPAVVATSLFVNLRHPKMIGMPPVEDGDGKVLQLFPSKKI